MEENKNTYFNQLLIWFDSSSHTNTDSLFTYSLNESSYNRKANL